MGDVAVDPPRERPGGEPVEPGDGAGDQVADPVDARRRRCWTAARRRRTPGAVRAAAASSRAVVALGQHPVGVREPVGLDVLVRRRPGRRTRRRPGPTASAPRPRASVNAGSTRNVTAVTMPSAPSPTRAAANSSASSAVPSDRACTSEPSPVTSSSAATCADSDARRPPVPCVPVAIAPATVCRSMSPRLCSARPRPCSRSLSTCSGVPASTVTVIASRSTARTPTSRSGRSSSPSVSGDVGERVARADHLHPEPVGAGGDHRVGHLAGVGGGQLPARDAPWRGPTSSATSQSRSWVKRRSARHILVTHGCPPVCLTCDAPSATGCSPGSPGPEGARRRERIHGTEGPRWFEEGAPIRQVHGDASMFVGGIRALLLQSLHPLAMAGVMDHSGFEGDPWGRLQRTSYFLAVTTFGTAADAERMVAAVRVGPRAGRRHRPGRPPVRRLRPAPAALGARRRDRQLPRRPPAVRRGSRSTPAGRDAYVARDRPGRRGARRGRPAPHRGRAPRAAARPTGPSCEGTPAARETARFLLLHPPLPLPARVAVRRPGGGRGRR